MSPAGPIPSRPGATGAAAPRAVAAPAADRPTAADVRQQRLKRVTQSIIGLPTLPTVVSQMIGLIDNPRTSARAVARLIATDQALTAKILKLANSAFYGFPRTIATVNHAVVVLGFETVKSLGLSVSVLERFAGGGPETSFDRQRFWEHSIAVGVAAQLLGARLRYRVQGEAFAAGILHDIGKLILSQYFPDEFARVMAMVREENVYIGKAEEAVLGVTHAEIGCWLAEKWNLPRQLVDTIAFHHAPGRLERGAQLPSLVHLADFLARKERIGDGGGVRMPHLDPAALRAFGIHEEPRSAIRRILRYGEQLRQEMGRADAFTSLVRPDEPGIDPEKPAATPPEEAAANTEGGAAAAPPPAAS